MNGIKKILSTIMVTSICLSSLQGISAHAQDDNNEPIKIMCVGDSITDGYWEQGGYRKYLYQSLIENGFNIDMVGDKGSNEENSNGIYYDGNYCGYSGYAIKNISGTENRNGIYEVLVNGNLIESCNPDIVLLQIGTNDILSAYNDGIIDRLDELVTYILSYMENTDNTLFVSTIPDIDVATVESWLWAYGDEKWNNSLEDFTQIIQNYIDSYNSQLKNLVTDKQANGCKNIQFADIHSVLDYKTDLYDGVHPSEEGYQKMGNYWNQVLTEYLSNQPVVSETTTVTEATTEDTTTSTESITETSVTEFTTTEVSVTTSYYEESSSYIDTTITEPPIIDYNCDINQDGTINFLDLIMVKKYILGISNWYNADVNDDNTTNIIDCIFLKNKILENLQY